MTISDLSALCSALRPDLRPPLILPLQQHQWALLKSLGVIEDDKAAKKRGKTFKDGAGDKDMLETYADMPGSLGAKLESKGRELLDVSGRQGTRWGLLCGWYAAPRSSSF